MGVETRVHGVAGMDKEKTGYRYLFFTDMTSKLNEMYGIDEAFVDILTGRMPLQAFLGEIRVPMTRETAENLRGAAIMHIASQHEANRVIHHFLDVARKIGQFAALPHDDVAHAAGVPPSYVDIAAQESYFNVGEIDWVTGKPIRVLELTDRLFPVN